MIGLVPILAPYAGRIWPEVKHWIEAATKESGGWWSASDVLAGIERDALHLWAVTDGQIVYGAVVLEIEQSPQKRIAIVALCAGHSQDLWLHLLPELEAWARGHSCHEMQVRGRPGWQRRLTEFGYQQRYITIGKPL